MIAIRYVLKDYSVDVLTLAQWAKSKFPGLMSADYLRIARTLKEGGEWEPSYYSLHKPYDSGPCSCTGISDPLDPWEIQEQEQKRLTDLCARGAAGDAQAAIEYCKAEMDGKVWRGVIG